MEDLIIIILTQLFGWDLTENLNHQTEVKKKKTEMQYCIMIKDKALDSGQPASHPGSPT